MPSKWGSSSVRDTARARGTAARRPQPVTISRSLRGKAGGRSTTHTPTNLARGSTSARASPTGSTATKASGFTISPSSSSTVSSAAVLKGCITRPSACCSKRAMR